MTLKSLTAFAAIAFALPAAAQDGGLTAEDARTFLEDVQPQAEQAVEQGDWEGVQNWLAQNIADDAPIYLTGNVLASEGPSIDFTSSMTGADLTRFAAMGMSGPSGNVTDVIDEYTLEVRIMDTWQLPDGKVAAAVAFYEHGAFKEGEGMPFSGPFSSATECALRMGGSADDIMIELAHCEVSSNI